MEGSFGNLKIVGYILAFVLFVLPLLVLCYFVQLRLLLIFLALWLIMIFYRGVWIKPDNRMIEFEIIMEEDLE